MIFSPILCLSADGFRLFILAIYGSLEHFEDASDQGPVWIEATGRGSAIRTFVDNVRQDAFERIVGLIKP